MIEVLFIFYLNFGAVLFFYTAYKERELFNAINGKLRTVFVGLGIFIVFIFAWPIIFIKD